MKKIINNSWLLIFLFVACFDISNAASANNRTSYSVGTDYKKNFLDLNQINTTKDAEYAFNTYSKMGWQSVLNTQPTVSNLNGKHSTGYYYLESSILFFSGHGNFDSMGWNYKSKGGDYAVNITTGTGTYTYSDGALGIGIGKFNNSQNDLVVFAGCKTAEGTNNIAKYIVDRGAETSIGWKVSIGDGSHTNWLERFNDELKSNSSSVQEAAEYASGFNYLDNGVKNYVIYGNKYQIPIQNFMIAKTKHYENKDYVRNKYIINTKIDVLGEYDKKSRMKQEIERTIINKIISKFDVNDFKVEINGADQSVYDYVLYVDGVRTDLGYTILTKDNEILSIYDNTKNKSINDIKFKILIESSKIKQKRNTINFNSIFKKMDDNNVNLKYFINDEFIYFDSESNKLFQVVLVETENIYGQYSVIEYAEEIL